MKQSTPIAIGAVAIVLMFTAYIGGNVLFVNTDTHLTDCLVIGKDRTTNTQSSGSDMRIYTENCGTLQVKDSMLLGRFDSADTYAKIEQGKTYNFHTVGWRAPIFSVFPNIIEVESA